MVVVRNKTPQGKFGDCHLFEVVDYVEKPAGKEYRGMFEAVIESIIEGREEARQEGQEQSLESVARNALTKGYSIETIQDITGLDIGAIKALLPAQ